MFPMNRKVLREQPVTIEYTVYGSGPQGRRVRKELPNAFAARQFYARCDREGRKPQVVAKTN